jgi:hypothetical protein
MLDPRVPCFVFPRPPRRVWRKSVMVVLFAAVLFPAAVSASTVAIVRPTRSTPVWNETVSRLHGELLSVGAEVQMVDGAARSTDARAWFLELAAQHGLDAIIDIVGDAAPVAVEVWVKGKGPGQFEVSHVDLDPGSENASERSAIRALEVLRSIFLEIDLASRARRAQPVASPPPAPPSERLDLELGAATLTGVDGVGLAFSPMARVGWALRPWIALQVMLAGLGTRPTVSSAEGRARVGQDFGVLGACLRWRAGQRVQPVAALSMGWLHTSVSASADPPRVGHSDQRWGLLWDGSVGAAFRIHGRAYATVAAHVQWAEPSVTIHFVDKTVATTGRPNLMLSLTLGAWL